MLVLFVAATLSAASRNWVYPLPVAWGLAAVAVAEQADRPMIALLAVVASVALVAVAGWAVVGRSGLLPLPRQQ